MSSTTSNISSLASRLRRTASNHSDSVLSDNLGYTSTRLAFDDDHATRVASSAQSFADSINTSPSSRVRRFLDSLSTRSSGSLPLTSEHRDLLRAGAAGEVMADLTRQGQFDRIDTLHGYLNSVLEPSDSQDSRLVRALPGRQPPSYHSIVSESPPPTYVSPLQTISSGSSVPLSSQSRGTSPRELDSALADMDWSPTSASSNPHRAAELDSTPITVYELDSNPGSARRQWANPTTGQTSLVRSVMANSSTGSHPASGYLSSPARGPSLSLSASSLTGQSKSRYTWNNWRSLGRLVSRSSRRSVAELGGKLVRRSRSGTGFGRFSSRSSRRRSGRSHTISNQSWMPSPLRIGRAPSLTTSKGGSVKRSSAALPPSPRSGYLHSFAHHHPTPSYTPSTLARSINSLASQTPSNALLRRQAEFTRSHTLTRQAINSALTSDALSRLPASLLGRLSDMSRASRSINQHFEEGSAFQAMSDSLISGSIPRFYRAAQILAGYQAAREVDLDEIDHLICGLHEYRSRLQEYQESSLAE